MFCSSCYERGIYEPVGPLTEIAEGYCGRSTEDCNLQMVDIYFARGAVECQTNMLQKCFETYSKQHACLQAAIEKEQLQLPDPREAIAYGSMGNGCMAIDDYLQAEKWYMKAFDVWDRLPGVSADRQIYVSTVLHVDITQSVPLNDITRLPIWLLAYVYWRDSMRPRRFCYIILI